MKTRSFDLCRDFGDHRILLLFPPAFFSLRNIPLLLFLLLLESCGMDLAKFLTKQVRFLYEALEWVAHRIYNFSAIGNDDWF